ncbi:MAG: ArsR family transcriptional regulator [Clostridiales bacterium]|nr:ArsR family transcriptional regulator [Clostridiales bacterium]
MRYEFFPVESRIVDLLFFPESIFFDKKYRKELESSPYMEYVPEEAMKEYEAYVEALKPYEADIQKFYFEDQSLPSLLSKSYAPFGYESAGDYLEFITSRSEEELLNCFLAKLKSLLIGVRDTHENGDAMGMDSHIELLEQIPLSDEERWKISKLLRHPKETTQEWIRLIKIIEPIFDAFYRVRESEVVKMGEKIIKQLTLTDGEAIFEMSNQMLSKELLPNGNILISVINNYILEFNLRSNVQYIRWGLDVEALMEKIRNAKESELKERVLLFKNLGDKTRYEVVRMIAQGVETAKEISEILGVSQATISYHIGNLTSSKLILLDKREGRYNYKVNFDYLESAYQKMLKDFKKIEE